MQGIDLDDLFGTKPPAPPASDELPPPPYDGQATHASGFPAPPPPHTAPQQSYSQGGYQGDQWQAPPPTPPQPQQHQPPQQQQQQQAAYYAPQPSQPYGASPQPPQSQYPVPQPHGNGFPPTSYAAPYTSPYPTSPSAAPPQPQHPQQPPLQSSTQSTPQAATEDDDRVQLEKIIRLRRELEQEQEREREKRESLQTWGCAQCTFRNKLSSTMCEMCGVARPGYTNASTRPPAASAPTPTPAAVAPHAPPRMAGTTAWQCGICLAPNEASDARCRVCQAYQATGTPIATTNTAAPQQAPSSAMPTQNTDWMCSVCGKVNPPSSANCAVCHGYQRNGTPVAGKTTATAPTAAAPAQPQTAATWGCPVCTFDNPVSAATCEACRTGKRPAHLATTTSKTSTGDKKKTWPCPTCTFINKVRRSKCDMCGTARPAGYAPDKSAADKAAKKQEEQSDDDEVQWQDDNVAKACNRCHQEFGMLRRRHHCRKCGYVFCATCSPFYLVNTKTLMPERTCVSCYEASLKKGRS